MSGARTYLKTPDRVCDVNRVRDRGGRNEGIAALFRVFANEEVGH